MANPIYIANPIYDVVFKYLMEDPRVACLLLSALLKKEVVQVEMRRNEYSNQTRTKISIFRIDFSAKIKEAGGAEHLVLIELQKTWLPTETLRFRQYLGVQYESKDNMLREPEAEYGLPIISIYLLGHTIGNLKEPIIYVKRKYLDYESAEITEGVPDPFVESLTHDSIIVQIPFLKDNVRKRLNPIFAVFDQHYRAAQSDQLLCFDENEFTDEASKLIANRLVKAASDPDVRSKMNVEEEMIAEIEGRDTIIIEKEKRIAEQNSKIAEQNNKIVEQDNKIAEQDDVIEKQKDSISNAAIALSETGMSLRLIAQTLNLSVEDIIKFLSKK